MLTPAQTKIAEDTYTFLKEHPGQHDQDLWMGSDDKEPYLREGILRGYQDLDPNHCGTTMCIAGAICFQAHKSDPNVKFTDGGVWFKKDDSSVSFSGEALKLLGLNDSSDSRGLRMIFHSLTEEALPLFRKWIDNGGNLTSEEFREITNQVQSEIHAREVETST